MPKKKKNNRKWLIALLCALPIIILAEMYAFSFTTEMLREASDVSVFIGIISLCGMIFFNVLLFTFTIKIFKK